MPWNTGTMGDTGRFNAMSSGQLRPAPSTGFWPSVVGSQQTPNGVMSTLGHGVNTGLGSIGGGISNVAGGGLRGIALLLGHLLGGTPTAGQQSNGITPSAGGWAIDKNGNLVESPSTTSNNSAPAFSKLVTAGAMSPLGAAAMGINRARNQI